MKKVIVVLTSLVVLLGAVAALFYQKNYTGEEYFTLINQGPIKIEDVRDANGTVRDKEYLYQLSAVNKEGKETSITFSSFGRPLTQDKYLSLEYHEQKGVLRWHEVQANDLSKQITQSLN
ncbi:YxeA family protein [Vagococcus zengguangii]|uniref:YxeA family protein n=1 Tax=Vagococcus zengguangii TaxID=2571750 RepID=UPI0011080880|nr:YxeA family protein [Vagococcus zengguangii]TLG80872.1 YxeA family protein [Vagococcus zengguangii]